jgi:predicted HicB family RNase H-like nuclease
MFDSETCFGFAWNNSANRASAVQAMQCSKPLGQATRASTFRKKKATLRPIRFVGFSRLSTNSKEFDMKHALRRNLKADRFTYRVTWSAEDNEYIGLCAEFPSLSWLARTPEDALSGIRKIVRAAIEDMEDAGELIPTPLSVKHYSGQFRVRIPPEVHRSLAVQAAEQGVSLNRLASAKLTS